MSSLDFAWLGISCPEQPERANYFPCQILKDATDQLKKTKESAFVCVPSGGTMSASYSLL